MNYPGTPLQRGSRGEAVQAVQRVLSVQQTGLYGPTTEQCVTQFQRARGLEADGIVGPKTWAALFTPQPAATADLGALALRLALAEVGTREQPLGSNRGPKVDRWNQRAGAPLGSPWCAAFAVAMIDDAARELGIHNPIPLTPSSSALFRFGRDSGRLTTHPEPGDLFLCIGGDTGHYHTGLVCQLLGGGRFSTVEGNSNAGGSANGVEVAYRKRGRPLSSCHFVRV